MSGPGPGFNPTNVEKMPIKGQKIGKMIKNGKFWVRAGSGPWPKPRDQVGTEWMPAEQVTTICSVCGYQSLFGVQMTTLSSLSK